LPIFQSSFIKSSFEVRDTACAMQFLCNVHERVISNFSNLKSKPRFCTAKAKIADAYKPNSRPGLLLSIFRAIAEIFSYF
jgi:hypothetical protein